MAKQCIVNRNNEGTVTSVAVPNFSINELSEFENVKKKSIQNDTFMKAPNGEDTNLTEEQWLYTRSQEFIDWFGDFINDPENSSKVVDSNGDPLIMWSGHLGKPSEYKGYDNLYLKHDEYDAIYDSAYFVDNEDIAKSYSTGGAVNFMTIPKAHQKHITLGSVVPFFLNIRNPRTLPELLTKHIISKISESNEQGVDGFTGPSAGYPVHMGYKTWVIKNDSQIKPASSTDISFSKSEMKVVNTPIETIQKMIELFERKGLTKGVKLLSQDKFNEELLKRNGTLISAGGFYDRTTKEIFLNESSNDILNTTLHEMSHPLMDWYKENKPDEYTAIIRAVSHPTFDDISEYEKIVEENYPDLKKGTNEFYEEVLAHIIGDNGSMLDQTKEGGILNWLENFWNSIKELFKDFTNRELVDIANMSIRELSENMISTMMNGQYLQGSLTLGVLQNPKMIELRGKEISPQTIQNLIKGQGVKQIERDIIQDVLSQPEFSTKKIDYNEFEKAATALIMPLRKIQSDSYAAYGALENYDTHTTIIYNSTVDHGETGHFNTDYNKNVHNIIVNNASENYSNIYFRQEYGTWYLIKDQEIYDYETDDYETVTTKNEALPEDFEYYGIEKPWEINKGLFGHTRVWTKGDVYNVAEVQSDAFQKGRAIDNLERYSYEESSEIKNKSLEDLKITILEKINNDLISPATMTIDEFDLSKNILNSKLKNINSDLITQKNREIYKLQQIQDNVRNNRDYDNAEQEIISLRREISQLSNVDEYEYDKIWREYSREFNRIYDKPLGKKPLQGHEKQFKGSEKVFELRLIRESIKDAAQSGFKKLRLPLPYTIASIEGHIGEEAMIQLNDDFKVGDIVQFEGLDMYILEDVGDESVFLVPVAETSKEHLNYAYDTYTDNILINLKDELYDKIDEDNNDSVKVSDIIELLKTKDELRGQQDLLEHLDGFEEGRIIEWDDITDDISTIIKDNTAESDLVRYWEDYDGMGEVNYVFIANDSLYISTGDRTFVRYSSNNESKENFKIEDLHPRYQPIAKRSEEMGKMLQKERGLDNFRIVTDEKGYDWYETDIKPEDAIKPVVAFQIIGEKDLINVEENQQIPSQLFDQLKSLPFITEEQALEMYKNIYSDNLNGWQDSTLDC